jgi:hypothetical protein
MIKHLIKQFWKPTLVVFGILLVAQLALLRANVYYGDDLGRAVRGYSWLADFGRYSSSLLATVLNVNYSLIDISPLTQILALLVLAITGTLLAYILCRHRLNWFSVIFASLIGLSPFMLEPLSYRFDAPYIAISVLCCIVPFIFWQKLLHQSSRQRLKILTISTLCVLITFTSYQASNGIFLVVLLGMILSDIILQVKWRKICSKALLMSSAYLLATLAYWLILITTSVLFQIFFGRSNIGYVNIDVFSPPEMFSGIITNAQTIYQVVFSSLNPIWSGLLVAILATSIVCLFATSKRRGVTRAIDPVLGVIFVAIGVPLSCGILLLLQIFLTPARTFTGLGVLLAIIIIIPLRQFSPSKRTLLLAAPSLIFIWSLLTFSLAYGNAAADLQRYGNYRIEALLDSFSSIYQTPDAVAQTVVNIDGTIGDSAIMRQLRLRYPVINHYLASGQYILGEGVWAEYRFAHYYGRPQKIAFGPCQTDGKDLLLGNFYHDIYASASGEICVKLKHQYEDFKLYNL